LSQADQKKARKKRRVVNVLETARGL